MDVQSGLVRAFRNCRRGNVAIFTALAIVPIVFALGTAADYGFAAKSRADMNAAADAAALSAVAPNQMSSTTLAAATVAQNMFNSQVSSSSRVAYTAALLADGVCVKAPAATVPLPAAASACR